MAVLLLVWAFKLPVEAGGWDYNLEPMFDNISTMTSQELVAEMKYAIRMRDEGKYYPQSRLAQVQSQLAANQQREMERYREQLKREAEVAKTIEELKEAAMDKVKEQGEKYYEEHEEEIQAQVEEQARRLLGMNETEWLVNKEYYTEMYEQGSEFYEERVSAYVETAQKAMDAYNAWQQAKTDHPEAPETAQNLIGFLNASKEVLTFAGEKMGDTPLRPIGEILTAYGEAASLGDAAAKAAWQAVHGDDINPNFRTQYDRGFEQIGLSDYGPVFRTDLMRFNNNLRILDLGDGRFAAFDNDFNLVSIGGRNTMTPAEFEKLQQMYVAYEMGKKKGWPELTIEQLVQLANGESVKVKIEDNLFFADKFKEFDPEAIMKLGHQNMNDVLYEEEYRSLDRLINGEQGVVGNIFDVFTRGGRRDEIREAFNKYKESLGDISDLSDVHLRESFLEYVKRLKEANPALSIEDIMKRLQEDIDKKQGDKTDEEKDSDKGKTPETGGMQKNPLTDRIGRLDPNVRNVNSSGVGRDAGTGSATGGEVHWTGKNPDGFNGRQDTGFTQIGTTHRPIPDPHKLAIPVYKPNIYLYPKTAMDVDVDFAAPEKLTATIPAYRSGWSVTAEPDGTLDGKYGYLFYEAEVGAVYFQTSVSWKLPVKGRAGAFEGILNVYGFNAIEKRDFIEFWNKKLDPEKQYLVYPQGTGIIDSVMPVKISPQPESVHRIWFYFIPSDKEPAAQPKEVERIVREGFTAVEWGGMHR